MKRYTVTYEVAAGTPYEAMTAAVLMLRDGVQVLGTDLVERLAPGWWKVTLRVSEDT